MDKTVHRPFFITMISQLSLQIIETGDVNNLRIVDSSVYNEDIDVSCEQLLITPPGFTYPAGFDVDKGFNSLFTSENLGLTKAGLSLTALPDGVYIIRYSINPNDRVWVEYYHLRNTQQEKSYNQLLCKLGLEPCNNIDKDMESNLKALHTARIYMDAAKSMVEYCNSPKKGMELYEYANKLIDKLESKVSSCKNC